MKHIIAIHRQQEFVRCVCNEHKIQTGLFFTWNLSLGLEILYNSTLMPTTKINLEKIILMITSYKDDFAIQ